MSTSIRPDSSSDDRPASRGDGGSRAAPARGRVVINGRFLTQPMSGIQRYATEIVRALDRELAAGALPEAAAWDWRLVAPPGAKPPADLTRIAFETIGPGRGHGWDQLVLARAARGARLLSLASSGPALHPGHLVVVHDASVYRHPEHYARLYGLVHRTLGRVFARTARLATVSEFSRRELSDCLGVPADRIAVAPNGGEHLRALQPEAGVADRLAGGAPVFVTVGNQTPNKNLAVAVEAFRRLPAGVARLVVVGRADPSIFGGAAPGVAGRDGIVFAGRLGDEALAGLLAESRALVFPSLYEGFGIPPLEAMAAGTRVIASDTPAVAEVCGDAADLFDPRDPAALAGLMAAVLAESEAVRAERIARGHARLALYRWSNAARTLAAAVTA